MADQPEKKVNPNKPVRPQSTKPKPAPPTPIQPPPADPIPAGKPVRPKRTVAHAPPKHPDVGKTVWMSCRGSRPCGGNQATIVMKVPTPGGGWSVRYQCQKCGTAFAIST